MKRTAIVPLLVAALFCHAAHGQVLKKMDTTKVSDFSGKEFGTKSMATKGYETKEYSPPKGYETKAYSGSAREFSYSSKTFATSSAQFKMKDIATPEVPGKGYEPGGKEFATKSYGTKDVKIRPLTSRIADKPMTDWQTLIRKEPPSGVPGFHGDIPFSQWKASSESK